MHSITQQSRPDWNLTIVVEPADSAKFQKLFEEELVDPRINLIINQGWRFPGAINSGIRYAKTGFVAILLADDMWASNAVETLNDYIMKYPEIDFFHSARIFINEHDTPISSVRHRRKPSISAILSGDHRLNICFVGEERKA